MVMPRADAPLAGTVVPSVWSARSDAGGVPEHGRTRAKERGTVGILSWLVFGAIAGRVASLLAGDNADQGWFGTIVGGVLYTPVTGDGLAFGWRIGGFVVAVVGAPVPIAGLRRFGRRERGVADARDRLLDRRRINRINRPGSSPCSAPCKRTSARPVVAPSFAPTWAADPTDGRRGTSPLPT